jgi:hypothetical protein
MDPTCKSKEEVNASGRWDVGEHGIHITEWLEVSFPMCPIAEPFMVIHSHYPSIDIIPHSSENIRKLSLVLKWKMFHKVS